MMDFGRTELLNSLVKRINRQFTTTKDDPVEQSLVIGVFGEWGSGKSYLLDAIGKAVNEAQEEPSKNGAITLPISFNPWRFEAEEHLIIPLLLTAQSALLAKAKDDEKRGSQTVGFLKHTARKLALISVAFASAFKGKMGIPGVGDVTFEMDKLRKAYNEEFALKEDSSDGHDSLYFPQELSSLYYNFHDYLKQVTGRDSDNEESTRLNLLFLIDDIDRCLPERAVNMMEAIKLFLEVEGCAFVLALDDEVVERGILHRYKDYLFQAQDSESDHFHRPPITGAEYLEKMIHLPVRLPLPTKVQTEAFLLNRFPRHFSTQENKEFMEHGERLTTKGRQPTQNQRELLDLFLEAVPPIPRKLVRTAELLDLLMDVAQARGINNLDPVMLARLVILQLFAPEIYRLGRRHPELMLTMAKWAKEHKEHWRKAQFLKSQLKNIKEKIEKDGEDVDAGEIRYLENVERPLLLLIQKTCQNRSGFDPRVIMFRLEAEQLSIELLDRYFSLAEEAPVVEPLDDQADERPTAVIYNIAELIENLFSAREEVWQAALSQKKLQGRVLDDRTFEAVRARCDELGGHHPAWLLRLADHLTAAQQQQFAEKTALIPDLEEHLTTATESLVDGTDNDTIKTSLSLLNEYASVHWSAALQQKLEQNKQAATKQLLKTIEQGLLEPKLRAAAGDTLAQLGDPRFDPEQLYLPTQYQGQQESHLGFIKIKGGSFMMGSNKNDSGDPYGDEMVNGKAHEVTAIKNDYWVARYPTTVAQYGAFIEDGGYTVNEFWGDDGQSWLCGHWDSQLSLGDFGNDEDRFKRVKDWLAQRGSELRLQPVNWLEQKHFGNRPVHGVSWFEVRAYCRWLNQQLQPKKLLWWPKNSVVRLPTEAEWEKVARAGGERIYPWDGKYDENKLNAEQKIDRVSTVGMYPSGVNPIGLHDISGNVWEWTHSLWRDYPYQPSKADWQTRQGGDRLVLRGGSWFLNHRNTRCAVRFINNPDYYHFDVGFRVVISLAFDL